MPCYAMLCCAVLWYAMTCSDGQGRTSNHVWRHVSNSSLSSSLFTILFFRNLTLISSKRGQSVVYREVEMRTATVGSCAWK